MSGAGKTSVLKFLEDINFFCVDNLPPALLPKFAELCYEQEGEIERVAMGIDIRGGRLFNDLFEVLSDLQSKGYEYEILFLDASDETLRRRKQGDASRSRNSFEHHLQHLLPLKRAWFIGRENVDVLNTDNLTCEEVGQHVKAWIDGLLSKNTP
jgi:RNase adaptor protein for sRNA GlmZ degradation